MVKMNWDKKDLIKSLQRSLPRPEGQVWLVFTYISILIRSIEVLPKCIASCSFSEVIIVLFSNFNGVD